MLSTNIDMLKRAYNEGFAIPAINTQGGNYDIIWAICKAADELRSPIILAHYTVTGTYSGNDWFVEVAKWCAKKVSVPVSVHLDHGADFDTCMDALKLGFTSLMIDCSAKPVTENALITNKVIEVAKCFKVPVEAEVGELLRIENGVTQENKNTANPDEVREFLKDCRPDTLAIGIGNAHGYYKGIPDLRLDILGEVRGFCDTPLVLHGCTGLAKEQIREAIRLGVAKINFGTEIRYKYMRYLREGMDETGELDHQGHSWKLSQYACNRLTEDIKDIIELSGSAGKA